MIDFDEATHTYTSGGIVLPSVTGIMSVMGLVKYFNCDDWYLDRGSAIHSGTLLIDQDALDWDSVDPRILGFLHAYLKFKKDTGINWEHAEEPLAHSVYSYAGKPDRWLPLYDIKGVQGFNLQLCAYGELLRDQGIDPGREAFFLHLKEDATYKVAPYKFNRQDTNIWLAAVSLYHWRKERGLLENQG